jgi:hypothetical protein
MAKGLTVAAVEKLKATGKRQEISDANAPGLLLVIQPTGAKSWAMRFRRPDGTPGKLVLGPLSDRDYDEAAAIRRFSAHFIDVAPWGETALMTAYAGGGACAVSDITRVVIRAAECHPAQSIQVV